MSIELGTRYSGEHLRPPSMPQACEGCIVQKISPSRVGSLCAKVVIEKLGGAVTHKTPAAGDIACQELRLEMAPVAKTSATLAAQEGFISNGPARF